MKLNRLLIGVAGLLFVCSQSFAADIYTDEAGYKDEPVYSAPVFSWTGFYAGVHAGYGRAEANQQFNNSNFFGGGEGEPVALVTSSIANEETSGGDGSFGSEPKGGLAGLQLGYNFQRGNVVLGLEGTLSGAGIDDKIASPFFPTSDTFKTSIGVFGTLAARLGYAWDRTLLYAKGGYAVGDVEFEASCPTCDDRVFKDDETMHGYVLGAGVEYALTDSWIVGVEYNYLDLGTKRFSGEDNAGEFVDLDTELDLHAVSARLSYKFGGEAGAPLK